MGPTRRDFADALLNDEYLRQLIDMFVSNAIAEECAEADDDAIKQVMTLWMTKSCEQGYDLITKNSESPLERVFLASLMLGFVKWSPMGLIWTPVFKDDAPTILAAYRADHAQAMTLVDDYRQRTGSADPVGELLKVAMRPDTPFESPGVLIRHLMEDSFHTWDTFHLTLQPRFKQIRVDGRTIRADALVWIPSDPTFNVVLECDGYDYHADKPRFTTDRRRDRVLASHGYQVMRFSGQEVFEDPISTATEAFDFLQSQRERSSHS